MILIVLLSLLWLFSYYHPNLEIAIPVNSRETTNQAPHSLEPVFIGQLPYQTTTDH